MQFILQGIAFVWVQSLWDYSVKLRFDLTE